MAPYELKSAGGSVEYMNEESGEVWLRRLRQHLIKPHGSILRWKAIGITRKRFNGLKETFEDHMYPMTLKGIEDMTRYLSR